MFQSWDINCVMTPTRKYLPSIDTVACSKAEIYSLCLKIFPLLPCTGSLKRNKIKVMCL